MRREVSKKVWTCLATLFLSILCHPDAGADNIEHRVARDISSAASILPYWSRPQNESVTGVLQSLNSQKSMFRDLSAPIPANIVRVKRSRNTGLGSIRSLQCFLGRQSSEWCDVDVTVLGREEAAVVGSKWLMKVVGARDVPDCRKTQKRYHQLTRYQEELHALLLEIQRILELESYTAEDIAEYTKSIRSIQGAIDEVYPESWRRAKRMIEFQFFLEPILGDAYLSNPGYWSIEQAEIFYQRVGLKEAQGQFPDYSFTTGNVDKDGVLYLRRMTDIFSGCLDNSTVIGANLSIKSMTGLAVSRRFDIQTYLLAVDEPVEH